MGKSKSGAKEMLPDMFEQFLALVGHTALGRGPREHRVKPSPWLRMWRRGSERWISDPDVRGAVTPWVAELMGQCWAKRLLPKVHQEVGVQLQPSLYCIYIDLQHHRAFPGGKKKQVRERSEVVRASPQDFVECGEWVEEEGTGSSLYGKVQVGSPRSLQKAI